jgi:hypothetical protein
MHIKNLTKQHVPSKRPPTRAQQQGSALLASLGGVLGDNIVRLLAPHLRFARSLTEDLALSVKEYTKKFKNLQNNTK